MDPSGGGGIGKAAEELMREMQKAQSEIQQAQEQSQKVDDGKFQQALEAQQVTQVSESQKIRETEKAGNVLLQAKVNAMTPSTRVGEAAKAEESKMLKMLEGMLGGQDKMNNIMNVALSGKQFSPPELLAMQAGVYRYSQELELTSKVVEKATSGVKQIQQTQV